MASFTETMKQIEITSELIKQHENRNMVEFVRIVNTEDVAGPIHRGCRECNYSLSECPPYANSIMVQEYKKRHGEKPMGCLVWEGKRHQNRQNSPKVKHGLESRKRLSIVGILKKFFTG